MPRGSTSRLRWSAGLTALAWFPLAGCVAATEGTGKGTGKETGGCYDGIFCEAGLECLLGFCVLDDDDQAGEGQAVDTGDGDADPDTGGPPPTCGDGVLDPDEACDGGQLAGESCQSLGWDMGGLSCTPACEFNLIDCHNRPQPGLGKLYSPCLDNDSCPGLDGCATVVEEAGTEPFAGFCSNFCAGDDECWADVGGTALPHCNDAASRYCELDCGGGRTCPEGMDCVELSSGAFVCY